MRLPSELKMRSQAREYSNSHPVQMSVEWEKKYNSLNEKYLKANEEWEDCKKDCPANHGGTCACPSNAKYKSLFIETLEPLCAEINKMYFERDMLQEKVHQEKLNQLFSAKQAKINYFGY